MYGAKQCNWNQRQHFHGHHHGWQGQGYGYGGYGYRHRKPFLFPALLLIGLLLWSGVIFKILFFVALFAVPAMLFARHYRDYQGYDYEDGSKRKNDEKPKRGSDPYYQDIEII